MTRVVVAGLGDTGVLSAVHLRRRRPDLEIVGVSPKPGLVSGQELGLRITRPALWERWYRVPYSDFRGLRGVSVVHGTLVSCDLSERRVGVSTPDGPLELSYDVLVVATGVSNGFWRSPELQTETEVSAELAATRDRLAAARSVAVVGGGAAAVSAAYNLAVAQPSTSVGLWFPGEQPLPAHHRRTARHVVHRLERAGVSLHPGHRAALPAESLAPGPVRWTTGQPDTPADLVLYAVGRVRPHTDWLPASVLDEDGFVRVEQDLRVPGVGGVFAIGDVAATDPLRSSARNFNHKVLAHNVDAWLSGRELRDITIPGRRWGSVLGPQRDGLLVFGPTGRRFRFPGWSVDRVLQRLITHRGIYGGIRRSR